MKKNTGFDYSIEIANKINKYFGGKIIGFSLLQKHGLDTSLIGDVDIAIDRRILENVLSYLHENSFEEELNRTHIDKYGNWFLGDLVFKHATGIPIHLCTVDNIKDFKVMEIIEILGSKVLRSSEKDIKQILSIWENMK